MRDPARLSLLVLLVAADLARPADALAYIDLGTGSYVLQVLLASVLGVAFALRAYWARIRAFFGRRPRPDDDP
jgi:hypothetical protein